MQTAQTNILALDVGNKRIGVAVANSLARLPRPLTTIINDENVFDRINKLLVEENASCVVVGLPRNLNGDETEQTFITRQFAEKLKSTTELEIFLQDEALTSHKAETELAKTGKIHDKAAVDALAATYILEDFLKEQSVNTGNRL